MTFNQLANNNDRREPTAKLLELVYKIIPLYTYIHIFPMFSCCSADMMTNYIHTTFLKLTFYNKL